MRVFLAKFSTGLAERKMFLTESEELIYLHVVYFTMQTVYESIQLRIVNYWHSIRDANKSLARPRRKQARKHVRDAHDFNEIETRIVTKFLFLHGKAPKEIHAILTETLASLLPGRAKDLSAPL